MLCAQCLRRLDTGAQRCPACGGDPLLGGRYRLDRQIAEASGESSYRATRVDDGLLVRIRAVDVTRASSSGQISQLRESAARITKLDHHSLTRALEHCEIGSRAWLIHEYVRGRTLDEFVVAEPIRVRDPGWWLDLLADVAGGLAYLHEQSPPIAHGQISASRILVADGAPRFHLLDLQLATMGSPAADVRALGEVLGSLLGNEAAASSDLVDLLERMLAPEPITSTALRDTVAGMVRTRANDERRRPPTLARSRRPTPRFTMLESVANPDGSVSEMSRPVPPTSSRVAPPRRRADDIPILRPDELSRELSQAYRATADFEQRQRKHLVVARVAVVVLVATIAALATYLAMHG